MKTIQFPPSDKCETCICNNCAVSELSKLHKLNAALDSTYEILGVGLVFFDSHKKVIHLNELAKARLHLPKEFMLLEQDLISLCFDVASNHKIVQAIRQLSSPQYRNDQDQREIRMDVEINGVKNAIMLQKLEHSAFDMHTPGIVMFMFEPKANDESVLDDIARIFGLTKAEAKLTLAIVNGMTANEYAEQHGVSINTAYSQIKDVLAKTGTRRQVELVKLVLQHSPGRDRRTQHNVSFQPERRCTII